MVVLLDEQFLVHSAVHRAILRLLRNCVGDDLQEQIDGRKVMGAARSAVHGQPSEYEEDCKFRFSTVPLTPHFVPSVYSGKSALYLVQSYPNIS